MPEKPWKRGYWVALGAVLGADFSSNFNIIPLIPLIPLI